MKNFRFYSTQTTRDRNTFDQFLFENVRSLLRENPNNKDTQIMLETFLNNQFTDFINSKDKVFVQGFDSDIFSSSLVNFCFDNINLINTYLDKTREKLNSDGVNIDDIQDIDSPIFKNYLFKLILNDVKNDEIINTILLTFFKIVTYDNLYTPGDATENNIHHNAEVNTSIDVGKALVSSFIKNKYIEHKTNYNEDITFSRFKYSFINDMKGYHGFEESETHMFLGGNIINIMSQCNFISSKVITVNKQALAILTVTDKVRKLLDKNINKPTSIPMNLPMIVKPKDYNSEEVGGYLLNDVEYVSPLFTAKMAYKKVSEVDSKGELYSIINRMMKTPFKVNQELFDYLSLNNHKHKLIIDQHEEHEFRYLKSRTKTQETKYQQFMSDKMLQHYIIKIANTFKDVPELYFPIMLDNRGRLYPRPSYLNYQGTELAKALLSFANPDIINRDDHTSIEYFLAYGSTCYGNGLNKKSYEVRVE
jgi:hypothetical protein